MPNVDEGLLFASAGFVAEAFTICLKYPFDLVKCRLQSVNYIFKYQSIPHAFKKEFKTNGISALYDGACPFLLTYTTFMALQFSIYERFKIYEKNKLSKDEYHNRETIICMKAGALAGGIAAALTNPLEAITVAMQTNAKNSIT